MTQSDDSSVKDYLCVNYEDIKSNGNAENANYAVGATGPYAGKSFLTSGANATMSKYKGLP